MEGKLLVGGLRGSSGKTAITLAIVGVLRERGHLVQTFKKGPDYIDTAWHSLASGRPCYCLDVYLMGEQAVVRQFREKFPENGIAVIEGNRGLFDGIDKLGSYSTAELSKLIGAPVLLVVDATKITRTTAAMVLGCQTLDPKLNIAGVVLNRVAGPRHRKIATEAIEEFCGIPVLGAVPKLKGVKSPERHLGLVTPEETPGSERWVTEMARAVRPHLDIDGIIDIAGAAGAERAGESTDDICTEKRARIGVIRDSAFPFYYPENLEALRKEGAELVWIRSLDDLDLPDIDGLYLGGGFPETHAGELQCCENFRCSLRAMVDKGLPVYAECGGTVYLGRRLHYKGGVYEMAGVLPVDFEFHEKPQGHGYTEWEIDCPNPFYPVGTVIRGHEFHYTRACGFSATDPPSGLETVANVLRGQGFEESREGLSIANVVAFYGHVHALGCPSWAKGMVSAAEKHKHGRKTI